MIETFLFVRLGEGEEVFRRWPTAVTLLCPRGRRSTERFRQNCRGFLPEADRSTVALDAFFFVIVIRRLVLVKPATGQKNCSKKLFGDCRRQAGAPQKNEWPTSESDSRRVSLYSSC